MMYYEVTLSNHKAKRKHVYATHLEAVDGVDFEAQKHGLTARYGCAVSGFFIDGEGLAHWHFEIRRIEASFAEYVVCAVDSGDTAVVYGHTLDQFAAEQGMRVDGATIRDQLTGAVMYSTVKM